ncbi:MAG: helix-turn-helix domain-containing protein [Ruminococcaceae bacterium]|nr:helix-turn-helix domain-containing protein [Oscillospiraceae bacterium]
MHILKKEDLFSDALVWAIKKRYIGDYKAHGHDFFEIEYVIKGQGIYEIDGKSYHIKEGMLFFMTPANVHAVKGADMELINVMFKTGGDILPFNVGSSCISVTEIPAQDRTLIYEMLFELVKIHQNNAYYGRLILECVFQKLSLFADKSTKPTEQYISKAITFILENFRKGITLGDVARNLGLSKAYLSDYFVKQTGINFKAYLDNLRFDYVRILLEFTDAPVGEVYADAGFTDYTNFSRRFKSRFGMSPFAYRKNNTKE